MRRAVGILLAAATFMSCLSFSSISADAFAIKGDLNGDGKISLRDASIAQKIDVGLITASSDQLRSGDINNDGVVNSQDSLLIQKYVCLDTETMELITPNKEERIAFVNKINQDRINLGLTPFTCTDAHYEAGTIRANEYLTSAQNTRPDGSAFYTVLTECNIGYNPNATPNQLAVSTLPDATSVYNHLVKNFTGENKMYTLLTSAEYNTVCVGSVKIPGNTRNYQWVIIIN